MLQELESRHFSATILSQLILCGMNDPALPFFHALTACRSQDTLWFSQGQCPRNDRIPPGMRYLEFLPAYRQPTDIPVQPVGRPYTQPHSQREMLPPVGKGWQGRDMKYSLGFGSQFLLARTFCTILPSNHILPRAGEEDKQKPPAGPGEERG